MIYLLLADGFEELEAIAPMDILRRCGVELVVAGVGGREISCARRLKFICDDTVDSLDADKMQGIILPGGPGIDNLEKSPKVRALTEHAVKNGLLTGAICAAPSLLGKWGLLHGKRAVCYPGYEKYLEGAHIQSGLDVCVDDNIITARGAGVAINFALALAERLKGKEAAQKVAAAIQMPI